MMRKPLVAVDVSNVLSVRQLHELLSDALDCPDWYGHNWDAFWDAITGLVVMPERLRLIGWNAFMEKFPRDARIMKECLDDMAKQYPNSAACVEYA
jgi:ribonuclease inhibitor